ncbi:Calcium and calcium/calmodulin-dependent serine/threonine-protein kinase [Actinidia chinensis var. chinensis]|uniref:Calcium and calcium/calmodulin-dependent serine/threonine-protein kinase n=1 Tax=Actinidia chinensis var. chinensis TaxID=1590841 RepID=A0A2R6QDS6_ACTCC|nr:Calcium and calcium/calmodulin-dependent serine/threonine-protein kinase [Actinidia chinensis var. chinensis]
MDNQMMLLVLSFMANGVLLFLCASCCCAQGIRETSGESAVGDPGMATDSLRVGFEGWNFCNEVGREAPFMGSPRAADCFHLSRADYSLNHKVTEADNKLGVGKPFPGLSSKALNNPDLYAVEKELYLGSLCEAGDTRKPWQFWMIMLKNGNYDTLSGLCPEDGKKVPPFHPGRFPCFGDGCMNQPLLYHQPTTLSTSHGNGTMRGSFNGTYDLGSEIRGGMDEISYFEVVWEKEVGVGSWVFNHKLKTSKLYPWLMLYLRADATKGLSGGYHYETRGMLKTLPESPNFKVRLRLDVKQGGGAKSQFYLIDMGSCWKNNGAACDGDVLTDVTRYSEMIINPQIPAWCSPTGLENCPPFHITPNDTKIYRNDTAHFPYSAYHYYCAPGNAQQLEKPYSTCDPYSNPQAQELVQLLPHPIWAEYGYPTKQGDGWVGDARTWELDVGGLSSRLYFYQDPGTTHARRIWTSLDVGTEIYVSDKDEVAEWTLSDFDVILTSPTT